MRATDADSTGGCHCRAVRYAISGELRAVVNCHCEPCRRITGHHMAATATTTDRITIDGADSVLWYRATATTEYGSCATCASTLFWRSDDRPHHLSVTAGSIDPPTGLSTVAAYFTDDHGDYHTREPVAEEWPGDRPSE